MPRKPDVEEIEYPVPPSRWPYISKSRLVEFVKNPRHCYYKYVKGLREPENFYMKRGSRVHEAIEGYYENVTEMLPDLARSGKVPSLEMFLPDDVMLWADFTEPFITNFVLFEQRRLEMVVDDPDSWSLFLPVAIEQEAWLENPPVAGPPWMGFADVILPAASVPEVDTDDGVVIVDFKTGKTPDEQYRDEGIFLEGEFYAMIFEDKYEIAAVAGYYPRNDDLVVSPLSMERRQFIVDTVEELVSKGTDLEEYPPNPQPLCKWGPEPDQESPFYRICDCDWGKEHGPGPTFA